MRRLPSRFAQLLALLSLLTAAAGSAQAASVTLVSDPFSDGSRLNGTDSLDVSWYTTGDGSSFYVGPEAPHLGSGNYISWNPGNTTFRAMHSASFQSTTLNLPGDAIRLSFDFRFYNLGGVSEASALRFGLYNDNGSSASEDFNGTSGDDNNDFGYYMNLSSGTAKSHSLWRENGGASGITAGTDRNQMGSTNTTGASLDGSNIFNLVLDLSREVGGLRIEAFVNGVNYFNRLDPTANAYFTFNKIAFGNGNLTNGGDRRYRFDNIEVQATVPEPATGALALLGGLGLGLAMWRKRRGQRVA